MFPGRAHWLGLLSWLFFGLASLFADYTDPNVRVQVWDHVSALNPLQLVGKYPDIAPPPAVRTLSADPGPYFHPRLFFSRSDWPELSGKAAIRALTLLAAEVPPKEALLAKKNQDTDFRKNPAKYQENSFSVGQIVVLGDLLDAKGNLLP